MSERLECECGADINPKFEGDMGFLFHVVGGHKVTVICDRQIGPYPVNTVICSDWMEFLRQLPDESVHCVVTSPPYWGLRDYGTAKWEGGDKGCDHRKDGERRQLPHGDGRKNDCYDGDRVLIPGAGAMFSDICGKCGARRIDAQLGLEKTPELYVAKMVAGFREVRRVLRKDGTLWLNLGDSYQGGNRGTYGQTRGAESRVQTSNLGSDTIGAPNRFPIPGLKPKDLVGIPWMVAFALRADGWWLRQDIIWAKPNPMPESTLDRCTKSHEYIFLLTKSARYFYDNMAIAETALNAGDIVTHNAPKEITDPGYDGHRTRKGMHGRDVLIGGTRNKRSVWTITTKPFAEAHFATFPPEIPETCIKAGCPQGGIVLDPFSGAGTVRMVAMKLGRDFIGCELNPEYIRIGNDRTREIDAQPSLFEPKAEQLSL